MIQLRSNPLSRMTSQEINRATAANAQALTLSGAGKVAPLIYGEVRTPGYYLFDPVKLENGSLVFAICWAEGESEGVQVLYVNDADLPSTGVTLTHYYGTLTQGVDPTLAAAKPGFADTFAGVAYTVIVVSPTADIAGWPRFSAVFRGKKVLNPATGITEWSQNAGLCIRDFIVSTVYGPGLPVIGWDKVAAYSDTLYDGLKRIEFNFILSEALDLPTALGLMSTYAECLWSYEGEGVLLVPDSPPMNAPIVKPWGVMVAGVDPWGVEYSPPDIILTADDIVRDSLTMRTGSILDAPTSMVVNYTPSTGTASPWVAAVARQVLVGVDEGEVTNSESSVDLPMVRRTVDALRRSARRLAKLQFQGRYSWRAFAAGIRFQKGDVVSLPNMQGLKNQWVRILDVVMKGDGQFQITAEHYDESMHADQINPVGQNGVAPVGLIIPCNQSAAPSGWALFSDADGRLIVFAGDEYAAGETGGSETCPGIAGETSEGGAHGGGGGGVFNREPGDDNSVPAYPTNPEPVGKHKHTYSTGTITPDLYRRKTPFIIKTGSASTVIPSAAMMLGKDGIWGEGIQRIIEHNSRYLAAGPVVVNAGIASASVTISTGSTSDAHDHLDPIPGRSRAGYLRITGDKKGGRTHRHNGAVPLTRDVKTRPIAVYGGATDYPIRPGFIALWQDPDNLPENWYLCNGENGTEALVNYFPQLAGNETLPAFGDNTLKIVRQKTSRIGHNHPKGGTVADGSTGYAGFTGHTETVYHDHIVDGSVPWKPPYYALLPIMYLPEIL